jgi:hypothetical protein
LSSVTNQQNGAGGARVRCATRSRRGLAPPPAPAALQIEETFLSEIGMETPSSPKPRRFRPAAIAGQQDGTTANERPQTMASAEAAKRLGPLIRNQTTNMGLNNFPKLCSCSRHPHRQKTPFPNTAHQYGEPCPFKEDTFTRGPNGNCCSLQGRIAACELHALDEDVLALRMHRDMS